MKRIHVCILTTAHPLDDVRVSNKFAQSFANEKFRVTWVGPDHAFFDHKNYNRFGLEYNLFSVGKRRYSRFFRTKTAYSAAQSVSDVDVYYCPEPDSAAVAIRLSKKNGAKVILDIHEVYHEAMLRRWASGLFFKFLRPLVRNKIKMIASRCHLVIGVSTSVLKPYYTENKDFLIVRSCAPAWFADGPAADVCGGSKKHFRIMHGKSTLAHGTANVLEALCLASRGTKDLQVVMFNSFVQSAEGFGLSEFNKKIKELGVDGLLDFRSPVPMQEMPAIVQSCDVGLIAYGRMFGIDSLPNKLFEYMAVGLPILAPMYSGEIAKIITKEECGLLVDFENSQEISDAILYLKQNPEICRNMGRNSREAFKRRHNWQTEVAPVISKIRKWMIS